MSTVQHIYNELFEGKTVVVQCDTVQEFHTLRTALCRKNVLNTALELTDGSITGKYDAEKRAASFRLAPSKRKIAASRWKIVATEEPSEQGPHA